MKVVILAGGLGTRISPEYTKSIPKTNDTIKWQTHNLLYNEAFL